MSIRLRLALAFAAAAALLFAVGGWLFAAALSSAQLRVIDSQLTGSARPGRTLPSRAGSGRGERTRYQASTWCRPSTPRAGSAAPAPTPAPPRCSPPES